VEIRKLMCLEFSPDARLLAAARGREICVWRFPERSVVWQCHSAEPVEQCAFSGDSGRLVTAGHGTIRFWNSQTGEIVRRERLVEPVPSPLGHCWEFSSLAASPDGEIAVCVLGYGSIMLSDGTDLKQPCWPGRPPFPGRPCPSDCRSASSCDVEAVAFTDSGKLVSVTLECDAAGGYSEEYCCYLNSHRLFQWCSDFPNFSALLSSDGTFALVWDEKSGEWAVFRVSDGSRLPCDLSGAWGRQDMSDMDVLAIARGGVLAAYCERESFSDIRIWDLVSGKMIEHIYVAESPCQLAVAPDRRFVAACFEDTDRKIDLRLIDLLCDRQFRSLV
jgi:WD40 repeat protein